MTQLLLLINHLIWIATVIDIGASGNVSVVPGSLANGVNLDGSIHDGSKSSLLGRSAAIDLSKQLKQNRTLEIMKFNCEEQNSTKIVPGNYCARVWDGALCWPPSPPNTLAQQSCPSYVDGFNYGGMAYKNCTADGSWYINNQTANYWTDYRECLPKPATKKATNTQQIEPHIRNFQLISRLGYSISFISLVIAFFIMVYVKRLRCPRNSLHLQLFVSFIIRSLMYFTKTILYEQSTVDSHIQQQLSFESMFTDEASNVIDSGLKSATGVWHLIELFRCKIFTPIWHYSLLANYNWILMEGLYLHNVIFFNIFNDNSNIIHYILLGWGLPIPIVALWATVKTFYDDATERDVCFWTINKNKMVFWILRAPITLSIILNFFFFINIIRVLFLKMFAKSAANYAQKYKYRTWFRSTLILMPLFGVHYMFLLAFNTFTVKSYDITEIIWLYTDLTFSTFQGCLVALLYCFLNNEVQLELRKLWIAFKQNITTRQLLRNNSADTQHMPSSFRTRNSFMSNIDCNSFFKKEEAESKSSEMNQHERMVKFRSNTGDVMISTQPNHGAAGDDHRHHHCESRKTNGETVI